VRDYYPGDMVAVPITVAEIELFLLSFSSIDSYAGAVGAISAVYAGAAGAISGVIWLTNLKPKRILSPFTAWFSLKLKKISSLFTS